jgi:hypothetical protein
MVVILHGCFEHQKLYHVIIFILFFSNKGLWRWYINTTITVLDIIHPVFYLKLGVSETGFCVRLEAEPTRVGPIDVASLCHWTAATMPIGFMKPMRLKPIVRFRIFKPCRAQPLSLIIFVNPFTAGP